MSNGGHRDETTLSGKLYECCRVMQIVVQLRLEVCNLLTL